ncbi:hypothetical protein GW17_00007687 [Ensete ventricosum]|nr:hypothetical protein GW17_00007687 [Ensete ventricosum]
MMMSSSQRNAYSYGDALYWDARYLADGNASFDWYQRYSALRPFVRNYVPVSARVLMVGCGNAGSFLFPPPTPLPSFRVHPVHSCGRHFSKSKTYNREPPRPGFQSHGGCSSQRSIMEPVPLTKCGQLPSGFVLEDPDSHYIYVCEKEHGLLGIAHSTPDEVN